MEKRIRQNISLVNSITNLLPELNTNIKLWRDLDNHCKIDDFDYFQERLIESDKWVILGLFLGYPKCCIEAFGDLNYMASDDYLFQGSGYRPCKPCAKK